MKKYLLIIGMLFLLCPLSVSAAKGNLEIQLSEKDSGMISYAKVGSMINGEFVLEEEFQESKVDLNSLETAKELEEAARTLVKYEKAGSLVALEEDGTTLIQDLEEGVYLLHTYDTNGKEICPTLVFIPTWMENEEKMRYDITVIPKYREVENPDTGWDSRERLYGGLLAVSAVVLTGAICTRKKYK